MTSFKHTLGPWVAPLDNAGSKGRAVWTADGSSLICVCQSAGVSLGGEQANARLCSASPELLDAALMALRLIKDTWIEEHGNRQVGMTWGALEQAIAKATGDDHGCL